MKIIITGLLLSITFFSFAQKNAERLINAKEAERIEKVLASDDMKGRKIYTPEIDRAADFIASEFKAAGLQTFNKAASYRQEFSMISAKMISTTCVIDNQPVDAKNVVVITSQQDFSITEKSGFETAVIGAGKNIFSEAQKFMRAGKNYLVFVDTSFARNFPRLSGFRRGLFKSNASVVFIMSTADPRTFTVEAKHEITEQKLANVVGILPGKSKKDEYVIFSGHYDHIGTGKAVNGDSIFNGANDDAAGTTAVIMLAKYFKALGNNERTIVFAAFTAEESGGFGAQYFSRQFDPAKVMAMFNIEMIGTESKWGKNSAYITGYEKTDMGKILEKNLAGTGFTFYPDPYPDQQLFYRSDNATLARLGVPAHTISTSKMDSEPNYHKVSDHVETLDMENMAMIIRSIALSSRSIVAGKDTPSRVNTEELR
ncbi:MAG: M20/M25/M40 family metallo-hydrolase [Chitinophagaceae bacterium]|nr:M20/M25/M40 family metallo-hydrolase [Chitinophagaceae bacterium]